MAQKVYVINTPKPGERNADGTPANPTTSAGSPSRRASRRRGGGGSRPSAARPSDKNVRRRWLRVAGAYVLGPVALLIWPVGRRAMWLVVGGVSALAGLLLVAFWSSFNAGMATTPSGVVIWLTVVAAVILAAATAWSRAVAAAGDFQPTLGSISPRWVAHPRTIGALGLAVPGLGFLIAGYPRRAACLFWLAGPLAVAVVILAHWRRLWDFTRSSASPGISGATLEYILIGAACALVACLVLWIVQALDAVRQTNRARRSYVLADAVGLSLLVAVILFSSTFRPASFASSLATVSATLHRDGLRVIPLGLVEAAAHLDPASPTYLARAASIYDEMGNTEAADARRAVIERRLREYAELILSERVSDSVAASLPTLDDRGLTAAQQTEAGKTWSEIQALIDRSSGGE